MIYQQCGPLCPQTCDNLDQPCEGGCAEGCFCAVGQVLIDGECLDIFRCTGAIIICMPSYIIAQTLTPQMSVI